MNLDKINEAIKDVRIALDLLSKHENPSEEEEQKLLLLKDGKEDAKETVNKKTKEQVTEPPHKIIHLKTDAFLLFADCLYQMARFEHALVMYHRCNRLREKIAGVDDKPRLGIQKATAGILAAFKNIEYKMKVDVLVDDGINVISQISYVFPSRLLQLGLAYESDSFDKSVNGSRCRKVTINDTNENNHIDKRKTMKRNVPTRKLTKKTNIEFCKSTKVPFREDIKAFKAINASINGLKGPLPQNKSLEFVANETLGFLKSRHKFWKSNTSRKSRTASTSESSKRSLEFDLSNIQFLEDDNPLQEEVEVIEEKFKLKKYYDFQDMYEKEDSEEIDMTRPPEDIDRLLC